jgi:hypothetical protein
MDSSPRASTPGIRSSAAALGLIDAGEESRTSFRSSASIWIAALPHFVERVRAQAEQERLVRLSRAVDADVRLRGGRQHAAQRVERLRADGGAVDAFESWGDRGYRAAKCFCMPSMSDA